MPVLEASLSATTKTHCWRSQRSMPYEEGVNLRASRIWMDSVGALTLYLTSKCKDASWSEIARDKHSYTNNTSNIHENGIGWPMSSKHLTLSWMFYTEEHINNNMQIWFIGYTTVYGVYIYIYIYIFIIERMQSSPACLNISVWILLAISVLERFLGGEHLVLCVWWCTATGGAQRTLNEWQIVLHVDSRLWT